MGLMDELRSLPKNTLGGTNHAFIDADTLSNPDGPNYRIQGINAAEVEKVISHGDELKYNFGTAGGAATTEIISGLANEQGFTNVVPQFNPDGTPVMDTGGNRQLVDLVNDKGESFREKLLQAGAFDINTHTTQQSIAARDIAEAQRQRATLSGDYTETAFDTAATQIEEQELAEGAKRLGFKRQALNEAELAHANANGYGHLYSQTNVQQRHFDRTLDNVSRNQLSDSWDQGIIGAKESYYGILNLLGEETGTDWLSQVGEDGVARAQANMADFGVTTTDWKDVDGVGKFFQYLGNNAALSLPYMGATAAGAAVTAAAAPVVGTTAAIGAGLSIPTALYSGQIWNEMEGDKNAAVAIAGGAFQAGFDRIGLSFIMPKGVASPKQVVSEAVKQYAKKTGVSQAAAKEAIGQMSRAGIAEFAKAGAEASAKQLAAKSTSKSILEASKDVGKGVLAGAAGEGLTEVGQETIGYLAATQGSDKEFNWEELVERQVAAAIAGSALGGAFSTPGSLKKQVDWADAVAKIDTNIDNTASEGEIFAAQEKKDYGRIASVEELAADARARWSDNPGLTIEERGNSFREKNKGKKWYQDIIENPAQLWQGATRNIFTPDLKEKSRSARILSDMFGGSLQRTFHGSSFENSKFHRVAVYKNMVDEPQNFYRKFGAKSAKAKIEVSDVVYDTLRSAVDKNGKFDPNLIPKSAKNRDAVIKLGTELNALSDRMYADQKRHNPELGYTNNYLFNYKKISDKAVKNNQKGFIKALRSEYNLSEAEARKITDEIIDNPEVGDIDEAFSVVKGGISPSSHKKRSLAMSEKKAFNDFMERDLFSNVSHAAKQAARYTAHRDYIGENGAVVNKLLDDMQNEGVPPEEVDRVAAKLQDYLDAESGNYKRRQTQLGKKLERVQKNVMMMTTLAGLPLATISSFVELALTTQALRKDQVKLLDNHGKELAKTMWAGAKNVSGLTGATHTEHRAGGEARDLIKDLGYYEWDVGAATVTGVTETNPWQQWAYEQFFKWNGLQGWTNYTRAVRASMAGDYMFDKAQTIGEWKLSGEAKTREVQEAEEALRNLGIDVDRFVELSQKGVAGIPYTAEEEAFMADTSREATFNWVNNAVALPQSANRPLIYQDPRFALFTQFQGFIATFTANHIPRLWGDYVKRGTPAMKYNAFATMATMIMLGFASQALKDELKYAFQEDEDEGTLGNPYLDSPEYVQRGIRASGLLGTGERVLDLFFPIYEQRSRGVGDWAWNQVSGESPAISYLERISKGLGAAVEGDVEKAVYTGLKASPVFGPFTGIDRLIGSQFSGWNFKGE